MATSRDIRHCAIQAMYQFDMRGGGGGDADEIGRASLMESPGDEDCHKRGFELARQAWQVRADADKTVAALTPEWPTHRQPALDRAILRLAYYEMTSGKTPPKVAINEAVELAKEFSTDKSPMFINGVLDKIYRTLKTPKLDSRQE